MLLFFLGWHFNYSGILILYLIISAALSIFTGAFSYVIFSIPFDLAVKFDPIKNDIASGKLSDINEAQKVIGEFIVGFFNYVGADIIDAKVHFKGSETPAIVKGSVDFNNIDISDLKQKRKKRIDANHKAFYLPVVFEKEELGYLLLIIKGSTFPFFYHILEYFEDFFLDDQIKCISAKNR